MAVSLYFGLPGAGKTSLLTQLAVSEAYNIAMGQSRYTCVITNVPIVCENVYYTDDLSWLGEYYVKGALYLIDEATLLFDSREYKFFAKGLVKGFVLHRHTENDIIVFVQIWNRVDKTIRDICDRVYYLHKGAIFKSLTYVNRIPYQILFPDENSNQCGDIIMGYRKCSFFQRLFSKRLYRPVVYGFYDTYWIPEDMKPLNMDFLDSKWKKESSAYGFAPSALDKMLTRADRLSDRLLALHPRHRSAVSEEKNDDNIEEAV